MRSPEEIVQHHAESLATFRRIEAGYHAEIERVESENADLKEKMSSPDPNVTDGGAHHRYHHKLRIALNELTRDMALDELGKLKPQIDEAEAALAAASKPLLETRPAASLETR